MTKVKPINTKTGLMTVEELDALVPTILYIEAWVAKVREEIQGALESGASMTHAALVPKVAIRKWGVDEDLVKHTLREVFETNRGVELPEDEVAPRKVLTPAAAEKLVGKKIFAERMSALVTAESSGFNLKLR